MKITIRSTRSIADLSLEIPDGSRTVLVGQNNSGKTTILDMLARATWSLGGTFSSPDYRSFSTTWFRREAGQRQRPTVELQLRADEFLPDADCEAIQFNLTANLPPEMIAGETRTSTQLVLSECKAVGTIGTVHLVRPTYSSLPIDRTLAELAIFAHPSIVVDRPITGHDPNMGTLSLSDWYTDKDAFRRRLSAFANRCFYVPAVRPLQFEPSASTARLTQGSLGSVTPLLARMAAESSGLFSDISVALAEIFRGVRGIRIAPADDELVPVVDFRSRATEHVGNMGFGFQNALHVLCVVGAAPPRALVCLDEPEQGLNQAAQRDLASALDALRPDLTIVTATQSEQFCRGCPSSANVLLVDTQNGASASRQLRISEPKDLRDLARAMGLEPLFLLGGGKIIYVEGESDREILKRWLQLNLGLPPAAETLALGGCGKIDQEYLKPLLRMYRSNVFILLDSDRPSGDRLYGPAIEAIKAWFDSNDVTNYYILRRRELENYLPPEILAEEAGVPLSVVKGTPGHEEWYDIKSRYKQHKGFSYSERQLSVGTYERLDSERQRTLFGEENIVVLRMLRAFLGLDVESDYQPSPERR